MTHVLTNQVVGSYEPDYDKIRKLPGEIPDAEASQAAAAALEAVLEEYAAAVRAVRAVDDAEASHRRNVRAEAVASVDENRAPKQVKGADFAGQREAAIARRDALLVKAKRARQALDAAIRADAEELGKRDAAQLPELYDELLAALTAATEGLERLLAARERAIEPHIGRQDVLVAPLQWHGPVLDGIAAARTWLADHRSALVEPVQEVAGLQPSLEERRLMAQGGEALERLYQVELAENFTITQFTRGHIPGAARNPLSSSWI